ncbi:MAG: hypothetical protein R3251_04165 [Candidatus Spechtbacterales bacterium]|nr:hypothetical protein [Candidatus Spechtbacterales bacterium]
MSFTYKGTGLRNCDHDPVSVIKPFLEDSGWNLNKWAACCSECGAQGVFIEGYGFFPDRKSEIESAIDKKISGKHPAE